MTKTVLITGASSGIGWATAEKLAHLGYQTILCGRREERLKKLQQALPTPSHILCFDVSNRRAVSQAIDQIPKAFQPIDLLINNAGNAHGLDVSHEASLDDWDAMIDGNVKGLLYVTKAVLPQMIERCQGQIINVNPAHKVERTKWEASLSMRQVQMFEFAKVLGGVIVEKEK